MTFLYSKLHPQKLPDEPLKLDFNSAEVKNGLSLFLAERKDLQNSYSLQPNLAKYKLQYHLTKILKIIEFSYLTIMYFVI